MLYSQTLIFCHIFSEIRHFRRDSREFYCRVETFEGIYRMDNDVLDMESQMLCDGSLNTCICLWGKKILKPNFSKYENYL